MKKYNIKYKKSLFLCNDTGMITKLRSDGVNPVNLENLSKKAFVLNFVFQLFRSGSRQEVQILNIIIFLSFELFVIKDREVLVIK